MNFAEKSKVVDKILNWLNENNANFNSLHYIATQLNIKLSGSDYNTISSVLEVSDIIDHIPGFGNDRWRFKMNSKGIAMFSAFRINSIKTEDKTESLNFGNADVSPSEKLAELQLGDYTKDVCHRNLMTYCTIAILILTFISALVLTWPLIQEIPKELKQLICN